MQDVNAGYNPAKGAAADARVHGPCGKVWNSVAFWRVFPWLFALAIIVTSDLFTLLFGTGVFKDCPQARTLV